MSCFKCGSNYMASRKYTMVALAEGSPKRGKNKVYAETECTQWICRDCGSAEMKYRELPSKPVRKK